MSRYVCRKTKDSFTFTNQRTTTVGSAPALFFLWPRARDGAGLRIFGRPIFGREGDAPELWTGRGKFEADFGFVAADGSEKNDGTFLFFRGALVLEEERTAAGEAGLQKDERAVGVDGERFGFFVEVGALGVFAAQANGDLHEDPLTAALGAGMDVRVGRLGHTFSLTSILPRETVLHCTNRKAGCQRVYSIQGESLCC